MKCQQALVWHIISPSGLPDTCPPGAWGLCVCVLGLGRGGGVCLGVLFIKLADLTFVLPSKPGPAARCQAPCTIRTYVPLTLAAQLTRVLESVNSDGLFISPPLPLHPVSLKVCMWNVWEAVACKLCTNTLSFHLVPVPF